MKSQTHKQKNNLEEKYHARRKLYLEIHCFQGENIASMEQKEETV